MKAELNLDNAPSATHRPAAPTVRPPARRRSPAPVILAVAALAAVGVAAFWFLASRGGGGSGQSATTPWIDLSEVTPQMRPVVDYLSPSPDEAALWFHSIRTSTYVRQKWPKLADSVQFVYDPSDDAINAFAGFENRDPARPVMILQGGLVRLSRLLGAMSLLQASAKAQGVEKQVGSYFARILQETGGGAALSMDKVVDLLNEFEVGTAVFEDVAAVSEAKALANGICKAVLGHEMGHLAGGHGLGADPNMTVSKNEESQADLFASSLAASMENGPYMLKGQIAFWFFLSLGEKQNPTNELFRSHPYSAERLSAAVRANKALAASMGIALEDAEGHASAPAKIAAVAVKSGAVAPSSVDAVSPAEESVDASVEFSPAGQNADSALAVSNVLEKAQAGKNGFSSDPVSAEQLESAFVGGGGKSLAMSSGLHTEFGAIIRLSIAPQASFQPKIPPSLVRFSICDGGLTKEIQGEGMQLFASAGGVKIGGRRYAVFENPTAAERVFVTGEGDVLSVCNAVMAVVVVPYDKGDTRRFRGRSGIAGGVSFPNADMVVQWSLAQPIRIDPSALAAVDFGGGNGSADCPVCRGSGYVKRPGPASYGQSHGDNWILVPCPAPSCRAGG